MYVCIIHINYIFVPKCVCMQSFVYYLINLLHLQELQCVLPKYINILYVDMSSSFHFMQRCPKYM